MRQHEAEQEAARRNAADERRDRLVFYALDESAGLSEDAWEVATRLRGPDEFQWEPPPEPSPGDLPGASGEEIAPLAAAVDAAEPPAALPPRRRGRFRPAPRLPAGDDFESSFDLGSARDLEPAAAVEEQPAMRPPRARPGAQLVRAWGYFVMLVGALFIAVTLAIWLGFRTYLQIGPVVIGVLVAAGVFAIWIGAQIARPPR